MWPWTVERLGAHCSTVRSLSRAHRVLKEWEEQVKVEMPPHMPENGYDEDLDALPKKEKKKAKKCLKNHRKAMSQFELAVDSYTPTSNIEATIVLEKFPFECTEELACWVMYSWIRTS